MNKIKPLALGLTLLLSLSALALTSCKENTPAQDTTDANTTDVTTEVTTPAYPDPDEVVYDKENIPVVYITTEDNYQVTSKKVYHDCTFRLELNGRYEEYSSTFTDDDGGAAELRARGNATYNNPEMREKNKYSYKLKLSEKANILGLGESKHWYLINNWRDTSNLRHKLAYDLSAALGVAHTDSQWVSLYYNGEYRGMYLLCESIRVANDRVDTFNWEEFAEDVAEAYALDHDFSLEKTELLREKMKNNLSWIHTYKLSTVLGSGSLETYDFTGYYDVNELDFTSGYLIEFCTGMDTTGTKWTTQMNTPVVMDNPFMLSTNKEMYNYVRTLIQDFEDAVRSPTFHNSKGKHYSEYVDVGSMVDYWIIWNFFCNNEFGSRSMYYYIDHGKIVFGPIWDFDQTIGNVTTVTTSNAKGDYWVDDRKNAWFKEIFGDPWFTALAQERWYEMRELIDDLIDSVDVYYNYIQEEANNCYERNGVRYYTIRQPEVNDAHSLTPDEDYELIRTWLRNRRDWINEHFAVIDPDVDGGGYVRSEKVAVAVSTKGEKLETDDQTVFGTAADYIIRPDATGTLLLEIATTHTNARTADVYINGTQYLGNKKLTTTTEAVFSIDLSLLNMENGATNVIYIAVLRQDKTLRSMSSVVIRVSDMRNPERGERIIQLGDEKFIVEKGSNYILPEITETREGYVCCGWTTDGETIYKPGDTYTVSKDVSMFIKWKRADMCAMMDFSRAKTDNN